MAPKTCAIDTAKIQAPPGQGCRKYLLICIPIQRRLQVFSF